MPAKSKSQQRLFGMVHACKKKGVCASNQVKKIADGISSTDAKDFAKTKHKGLPNKVKKKRTKKSKKSIKSFKEYVLWKESLK